MFGNSSIFRPLGGILELMVERVFDKCVSALTGSGLSVLLGGVFVDESMVEGVTDIHS